MPSTTTFRIGGDLTVGRLGFGAMHLPTERPEDREAAVTVARRAVELGITPIALTPVQRARLDGIAGNA